MVEEIALSIVQRILKENGYVFYTPFKLGDTPLEFDTVCEKNDSVVILDALDINERTIPKLLNLHGQIDRLKHFFEARDVVKDLYLVGLLQGEMDDGIWKTVEQIRRDASVCRSIFLYISTDDAKDIEALGNRLANELKPVLPFGPNQIPVISSVSQLLQSSLIEIPSARNLLDEFLMSPSKGVHRWVVANSK